MADCRPMLTIPQVRFRGYEPSVLLTSTKELQAMLLYEDLSRKINGAAIEVHREPVTLSEPGPE